MQWLKPSSSICYTDANAPLKIAAGSKIVP